VSCNLVECISSQFFHVNSLELSLYDCVICEYSVFFFFLPNAFPLSSVVMSSTNSKFPKSLFPLLFIYLKKNFSGLNSTTSSLKPWSDFISIVSSHNVLDELYNRLPSQRNIKEKKKDC
jgi:hypothetical protein